MGTLLSRGGLRCPYRGIRKGVFPRSTPSVVWEGSILQVEIWPSGDTILASMFVLDITLSRQVSVCINYLVSDDLYLVDDVFETVSCGPPHACASGMLGSEVWLDDKRLVSNSSTDGLSRKDAKLHGLHINHLTPPSVRFEARGAGARVLTSLLFAVWL